MAHLRPSPAPVNPSSPSRGTWWNLRQNATLKKVLRLDYVKVTWQLNHVHERERMVTWGSLHQSKAFDHDIYFRLIMKSIIVSFNLISIAANIKRIQFEKKCFENASQKNWKTNKKKIQRLEYPVESCAESIEEVGGAVHESLKMLRPVAGRNVTRTFTPSGRRRTRFRWRSFSLEIFFRLFIFFHF